MGKIIKAYRRRVHFYETDQMGIAHNSNYYRWFEEARIHFMSQTEYPYRRIMEMGINLPLIASSAKFLKPTHFDEELIIKSMLTFFNGYKLSVAFEITKVDSGECCTLGEIQYAVLSNEGIPINLEKSFPDVYQDWLSVLNVQSAA